MSQLVFDENLVRQLETAYRTGDVRRRRALVSAALAVRAGKRVLDVGCGPGFYAEELLEVVGADGSVVGIDASPEMLAAATARCASHRNVAFHRGDATALPVADASFDAALCVQVLEYVPDATLALAEIHRALRPGGRAVVWDVDWATVSWHSEDPARMEHVLRTWDEHLTHPSLPRTLGAASGGRLRTGRCRGARLHHGRARSRGLRVGRPAAVDRALRRRAARGRRRGGAGMGGRAARARRAQRAVLRLHPVLLHRGPRALSCVVRDRAARIERAPAKVWLQTSRARFQMWAQVPTTGVCDHVARPQRSNPFASTRA